MKKIFFICFTLATITLSAQEQLEELTFKNSQDPGFFMEIDNNTEVKKYISANGSILTVGDTLIIGNPTGSTTSTTAVTAGKGLIGVTEANSKTKSSFATIILGKPSSINNILDTDQNASADMQGEIVLISKMQVFHKGSKKKPLRLQVLMGEIHGRAFGIYKYISVTDYEKAILTGEIKSTNTPITADEAIEKLKKSKELLDLGIIDKEKYEKIKAELTPIILSKE